ncbi:MAG: rhamnogalacturonan acetylesterase, partial [Segetibacter sp.]|nr:rhamnogalacturonan acetylesterase [Segetibacter sp.]
LPVRMASRADVALRSPAVNSIEQYEEAFKITKYMNNNNNKKVWLYTLFALLASCAVTKLSTDDKKPVFYIIGDSTVRNGDGSGKNQQWGWGSLMAEYFDTTKISVQNHAIGGRSSRTFITEGRWDKIMTSLKKGDFVIMQFGHNDDWPLDDTARARGSIKGIGEESKEIYNPITKKREVVYTYGHYMRRYIRDAKSRGAIPIVCSRVPGDNWKDGKVSRVNETYGLWARQTAEAEGVFFIDLNNIIADKYEAMGAQAVKSFFPTDHTHTNLQGARLNAAMVFAELKRLKPANLNKYFR